MAHLFPRASFLAGLLALAAACGPVELPDDAEACAGVNCTAGTCFSNAGQAMCRCGPWEQTARLECHVAVFKEPDDHGGSPDTATVLTLPMSPTEARLNTGTRASSKDRDLFVFTSEARHAYAFGCELRTLTDCRVKLRDAAGNEVPTEFDVAGSTRWWFATLDAGTWYMEVASEQSKGGLYRYQVVDLGRDDHGNTRATATRLQDASTLEVVHSSPFDVDAFLFRSRPGHGYRFICRKPDNTVDMRSWDLQLTSAVGTELDSAQGSFTHEAAVALQSDVAADWLVELRVRGLPSFPAPSICRFEDLGPDEHSGEVAGATPIRPGVPVRVALQSEQDVDMLSFTGEAGHYYTLSSEKQGTWAARVMDASGQSLATGTVSTVFFTAQENGTYYVRISGGELWNPSLGDVRLVDSGPR